MGVVDDEIACQGLGVGVWFAKPPEPTGAATVAAVAVVVPVASCR